MTAPRCGSLPRVAPMWLQGSHREWEAGVADLYRRPSHRQHTVGTALAEEIAARQLVRMCESVLTPPMHRMRSSVQHIIGELVTDRKQEGR